MMMQFTMPVEAGNHAARTGAIGAVVQELMATLKPEAAYFGAGVAGERGGFMVFDMKDSSEIPGIAEQLFLGFHAKVTFFPVMNAQDLAKALPDIEKAVKAHNKAAGA
jgi:hypothetical protein